MLKLRAAIYSRWCVAVEERISESLHGSARRSPRAFPADWKVATYHRSSQLWKTSQASTTVISGPRRGEDVASTLKLKRCALALGAFLVAAPGVPQTRMLDDFSTSSRWRAAASDGVTASGTAFEGGLRLDYDFTKGSGYAFLRRELPLDLPTISNCVFGFVAMGRPMHWS